MESAVSAERRRQKPAGDGEATSDLVIFTPGSTLLVNTGVFTNSHQPYDVMKIDMNLFVGQTLGIVTELYAVANAGNTIPQSLADVSHTGRLSLDFATSGFQFRTLSGHDYRTTTDSESGESGTDNSSGSLSVPEPSPLVLLALGLAAAACKSRHSGRFAHGLNLDHAGF